MKTVDTKIYLDTLCQLANKGETVSTVVSGGSMIPFLSPNRDYVFLKTPDKPLKKGDIVLFTRDNGNYALHRIKKATQKGYYLTGDRQTCIEGPVEKEKIHCIVTAVKRKGKLIENKSFVWKFYEKIWINLVFLRPVFFKAASLFRRKHS